MIHERDLLLYAGGAALEQYGTLVWRRQIPRFGGEELQETFSRTGQATYVDRSGILRSAAAGIVRVDWPLVSGERQAHVLLEGARTQVAANPQAPNSWTNFGTPIITTGITEPWGGTGAILVEDDNAAGVEGKVTTCAFTGDGEKCIVVAIRGVTAPVLGVRLRDSTAAALRHAVSVTWQGGTTAPIVATTDGSGRIYPSQPAYDANGGLWWLVRLSATGVIAANTNVIDVFVSPASSTGTFYLAGANAFDATFPSSWQGASLGTRNADVLSVPFLTPPQAMQLYLNFIESEAPPFLVIDSALASLEDASSGVPNLRIARNQSDVYTIDFTTTLGLTRDVVDVSPSFSDKVEILGTLYSNGDVDIAAALNGEAVTVGAMQSQAAGALPAAWSGQRLYINQAGNAGRRSAGNYRALLSARGTGYTMDDFRSLLP